jgi:hypothetical protein
MGGCGNLILWVGLVATSAAGCARDHGRGGEPGATPSEGGPAAEVPDAALPALSHDEKGHVGAQAFVRFATLESAGLSEEAKVEGDASFAETSNGVDLQVMMRRGCVPSSGHSVFILQGSDCSPASVRGPRWDAPRGEGITEVTCDLSLGGSGRSFYTRPKGHAKPWTIGTPKESNLLGHAAVLTDAAGKALACGVITRTPDVLPPKLTGASTNTELNALLAGICLAKTFVPDSTRECPNPGELTRCSREHCRLDQCAHACSEFLTCLEPLADPCQEEFECEMTQACSDCRTEVSNCTLRFCTDEIACAPPAQPDGPCARLEACCAMQGDETLQCMQLVRALERLSGDASCLGAMQDWDVVSHLKVPCKFD